MTVPFGAASPHCEMLMFSREDWLAFCSSLAWQSEADVAETSALAARAGITVVSLPLVNEWTQVC